MKRIATLLIIVLTIISCSSEERYVVKGKIEGSDGITFYLKVGKDGNYVTIDSAVSKRGSFKMKGGAIEYPQVAALAAGNKMTSFYLENSNITIKGSLDSLFKSNITGSKTHDEYKSYLESIKPISAAYQALCSELLGVVRSNDEERAAEIRIKIDSIGNEIIKNQKEFVINHPASYVTPSFLLGLSGNMGADELESYINNLDASISNLPAVKPLKERVAAMRAIDVGKKAPDFTIDDVDGNPVSLYSKVGSKVLLINFWAAWHNLCRSENSNLVRVYNEFNKKDFDIIGVSFDRQKTDWAKAIEDDKLTWTQVSDIKAWDSPIAAIYAVNVIPTNFLLDENGIIIAKNLQGEELYNKIKEILERK